MVEMAPLLKGFFFAFFLQIFPLTPQKATNQQTFGKLKVSKERGKKKKTEYTYNTKMTYRNK